MATRMRGIAGVAAACACTAALLARGSAAQEQTAPTPQFRAAVDLVELDVSVLDKDRHPVRGLTTKDFAILEDGVPQDVSSFSAVDVPASPPPTARWMKTSVSDLAINDTRDRRMFVLFIDDATIGGDLASLHTASQAADAFIDQLGDNDLAAVVFSWDSSRALGFTSDHGKLHAAVDRISPGPGSSAGLKAVCNALWASTGTLRSVTELLTDVPHRRKAIIDISPGPAIKWGTTIAEPCQSRAIEDANATFAAAQRGNVAIYGVDPGGLRVLMAFDAAHPPAAGAKVEDFVPPSALDVGDFLLTAASTTGGRVIMNTNDPMRDVPEIVEENGSYYLLGYVSKNTRIDGSFRRLDVRVDRPDVTVHARKNYYAPAPPKPGVDPAPVVAAAATAIVDLVPKSDLPLGVTVAPFAGAGGQATLAVVVQAQPPTTPEGGVEHLDLVSQAFTTEGKPCGFARQNVAVVVGRKSSAASRAAFEVLSRLDVLHGHCEVRVGIARDALAGSVHTSVEVPDFAHDKLSMSGVVLSASPALPIAPKDELHGLLPPDVIPTAVREFTRDIAVTTFLRVYEPSKGAATPVDVRYAITDEHDREVFAETRPVPAASFATDSSRGLKQSDLRVPLPIANLAPGAYLLTVDASIGKTPAHRELQFRIH